MKQFLFHVKLVILDSFSIVIVFVCGLEILFTKVVSLKLDTTYELLAIIPIIVTLLFTISDTLSIACYKDLRSEDFDTYRLTLEAEKTKSIRVMRGIMKIIKVMSVLTIILSIVIVVCAKVLNATSAIVAYIMLLILATCHLYVVTKKI